MPSKTYHDDPLVAVEDKPFAQSQVKTVSTASKAKEPTDAEKKLAALKQLAERFRAVADDRPALVALVNATRAANKPEDAEIENICSRMVNAPRGDDIRGIADEYAARTV